jgi:hypothetical protein
MNVHSATCSCSVELYKLWCTLADFLPNCDISRFFYILFAGRDSEAVVGRGRVGGHNLINMTIIELYALSRICSKTGIFAGFSLYNINFIGRNSEAAMAGGGAVERLQFLGCSVAQLGSSVAQ